ncbi:hypothetical protein [Quatrionicoccus australiensis]|uniref:hypothetical protein n=1 Tax=Quatrionicoccus australiensis TaxID=138118 RepID=UPI001CF900F7|nr:hypothetical protein [Quatrionicoccus australiensis]UCV13764.1 hypothetical protein KI612_12445 [Quatrionicoccus australiensis]
MASFAQILFFVGIGVLAAGIKWGMGWALGIGFIALLIPCAIPVLQFLFRPYR